MAELAMAVCSSHSPLMEASPDTAPEPQRARFFGALEELRTRRGELGVDAVIVISNEHFTNFFLDNYPQVSVGLASAHFAPVERWLGIPQGFVPGAPELARHLHREVVLAGFEVASSEELRLDHGVVDVYYELDRSMATPLVPIIQNCSVSPLMPLRRCFDLGRALGDAIRSFPGESRVALVGAGGLSHDIGTPRIGRIDEAFDRWFLGRLEAGDLEAVLDMPEEELAVAGNGAQEIRSWLTAAGAVWPASARTLAYEPIREWLTGMAVMALEPAPARANG